MAAAPDFSRFVPGFDFLQGLMKTAGQALPDVGLWIAPTVDPLELEKRIEQLKTVQFWLDQNSRMLQASIQALEVQRMTLSTLQSMNVPVSQMADLFKAPATQGEPATAPAPEAPGARRAAAGRKTPSSGSSPGRAGPSSSAAGAFGKAGAVDPMKWWGALTEQFGHLAANALKDSPVSAAPAQAPAAAPSRSRRARPAGRAKASRT